MMCKHTFIDIEPEENNWQKIVVRGAKQTWSVYIKDVAGKLWKWGEQLEESNNNLIKQPEVKKCGVLRTMFKRLFW